MIMIEARERDTPAMVVAPPDSVVRAFDLDSAPVALPGGEGVSFRAGGVVLKRVHDALEAQWIQELLAHFEGDGIRIAPPVRAADGRWVVESWTASEYIAGLVPVAPQWERVVEIGLRFGVAADRAMPSDRSPLFDRTHRWAVADRAAWGEATVDLSADAAAMRDEIADLLLGAPSVERRFVHGDLTGNVFADRAGCPVVLDVSPYVRDPRWAGAIVVADAVLWHGADASVARDFATAADARDLLGRAVVFRLVAEQLATNPRHGAQLDPFRRLVEML